MNLPDNYRFRTHKPFLFSPVLVLQVYKLTEGYWDEDRYVPVWIPPEYAWVDAKTEDLLTGKTKENASCADM